jgi:hypothetical protein
VSTPEPALSAVKMLEACDWAVLVVVVVAVVEDTALVVIVGQLYINSFQLIALCGNCFIVLVQIDSIQTYIWCTSSNIFRQTSQFL